MFRLLSWKKSQPPMHRTNRTAPKYYPLLESLEERAVPAQGYLATNLVSDQAGVALLVDPNMINAWGFALPPSGGNFWVSNAETGTTSLFHGDVNGSPFVSTANLPFVNIPGANPTGQVFNGTSALNGDPFLFVSEDGTISGWRGALGTNAERFQVASDAIYEGAALATIGGNNHL